MAYLNHDSPVGSGSNSPSTSTTSSLNISPDLLSSASPTMIPSREEGSDSPLPSSSENSVRTPVNISRSQSAGKGGCWTCRVRRKKCDEQREGDSCKTCKRLTIQCLGWGPKRPEWMRDKRAVDEYKASIKARLTQQGLIRGQPRSSAMHVPSQASSSRAHNAAPSPTSSINLSPPDYGVHQFNDPSVGQNCRPHPMIPGVPGASNTSHLSLDQFNTTFNDAMNPLLQSTNPFYFANPPLPSPSLYNPDSGNNNAFLMFPQEQFGGMAYASQTSTNTLPLGRYDTPSGQTAFQEGLVMRYFEHEDIRKVQFGFAANTFTDITYQAVIEEPRGAVTNSICALVDLFTTQMRVVNGLEPPNANLEHPMYLRLEALNQLENGIKIRGWKDSDAIAALHLVSFSQLSGGHANWEEPFAILCDWMSHTGLPSSSNPWNAYNNMSPSRQLMVKATLWLDTFSCLSLCRRPKFALMWHSMIDQSGCYWEEGLGPHFRFDMATMTGCPEEVMLAIGETANLAQWKAIRERNGSLSYRELVHKGDDIERRLRRYPAASGSSSSSDIQNNPLQDSSRSSESSKQEDPDVITHRVVRDIFRETAVLYLHTVLSKSLPDVPEIITSVDTIIRLLSQLQPSDVDRRLSFPICLTGCLTNNSNLRELIKGRFRYLNESIGNLMQTRLLMEAVWQKRDVGGGAVDLCETIRERRLNLLLL